MSQTQELLLSQGENAFDRNSSTHHVTGSSLVISSKGLLLHFHKKIHRWIQPGGHLDPGETPLQAAIRETFEETGVNADFELEIFHIDVHEASGHTHYDIRYLARSEQTFLNPAKGETKSVAWFKTEALSNLPDISNYGAFSKLMRNHFA